MELEEMARLAGAVIGGALAGIFGTRFSRQPRNGTRQILQQIQNDLKMMADVTLPGMQRDMKQESDNTRRRFRDIETRISSLEASAE